MTVDAHRAGEAAGPAGDLPAWRAELDAALPRLRVSDAVDRATTSQREDRDAWLRTHARGRTVALTLPEHAQALAERGAGEADTVVLLDVLETVEDPSALLRHVARVLRPDGVVLAPVVCGLNPDPRHRRTLYPASLLTLVAEALEPRSLDLADGVLWLVAGGLPAGAADAFDQAERLLLAQQPRIEWSLLAGDRARLGNADLQARVDGLTARVDYAAPRAVELERKLVECRRDRNTARERAAEARQRQRDDREALVEARGRALRADDDLHDARQRLHDTAQELHEARRRLHARAVAAHEEASRLADLERQVARHRAAARAAESAAADLRAERARLLDNLARERWKRRSMQARRWWRLGEALFAARSSPAGALRLPFAVVRGVFGPRPAVPEPPRRAQPRGAGG